MARVTWAGMSELMEALRQLPEHLVGDATPIVTGAADRTYDTVEADYRDSAITGALERGLKKETKSIGPFGVAVVVRNTAPIAWMYENGTEARHTHAGVSRGAMPPKHIFISTAERNRTAMYEALKQMLVAWGFLVH